MPLSINADPNKSTSHVHRLEVSMSRVSYRQALLGFNLFLGVTAVAGGLALLLGWMSLPLSSLAGSPFPDYTIPAWLLVVAVGGTALAAAGLLAVRVERGIVASLVSGSAIITYEIVEWNVFGFSVLLAVYIGIGAAILALAAFAEFEERATHPPHFGLRSHASR
jgi:hypothetical protein